MLIVQLGVFVAEDISQKVGAMFNVPELVTVTSAAVANEDRAIKLAHIIFLFMSFPCSYKTNIVK